MYRRGFTLIEMLIIAPVVILAIGGFIALIVNMTGEVLSSRGSNSLAYEVQDTLNRIEQDVKLSTTFLAENTIDFSASNPQGFGDHGSTTNFANVTADNTALILGAIVTNANPVVAGTNNIYLKDAPNACTSFALYSRNTPLIMNIVYFIDDRGDSDPNNDTLWRRTIMPTNYTTTANLCGGTPWQQPSCKPGYSSSFCKTNDVKLVEGVSVENFVVEYYPTASSSTPTAVASNPATPLDQRKTALEGSQTVKVTLTAQRTIAGRDISRTATLRATRLDANATAIGEVIPQSVVGATPAVSSRVVDGSDVIFEWPQLAGATSYSIDYRINNGSWIVGSASLSNTERSYKVTAAYNGAVVEARVRATDAESQLSNYGNNSVTVPIWAPLPLVNNWVTYATSYASPAYTLTSAGMVVLKGLVAGGTVGSDLSVIATLPEKYRPTLGSIMVLNSANQAAGRLDIRTTGEIVQRQGTNPWVSLDGVSYLPGSSGFTTISTFANGWLNYTPTGGAGWPSGAYKTDSLGRVFIRGLFRAGTTTSGTTMFTMPAGLMPDQYLHMPQFSGNTMTHIGLNPTGSAVQAKTGASSVYNAVTTVYFPTGRASGATCTTQWCTLPLANGWVHYASPYATPQYTKASDGMVHIKGLIRSGTATSGTPMTANLPAAYCPKERLLLTIVSWDVWGRVDVVPQTGGVCHLQILVGNNGWLSLDSIRYFADSAL